MKLIKNAIVYKAEIPSNGEDLHNHLSEKSFTPPLSMQIGSAGFVPPFEQGCSLVREFIGGLVFTLRHDEKVIPSSTVNLEVKARIQKITDSQCRKVDKHERAEIKDQVYLEMCTRALVRTTVVNCFYHRQTGFLIVATSSKKMADMAVSQLVHAVGSVKTETINVSDVKGGLTARLKNWLPDHANEVDGEPDAFGAFEPCGEVSMVDTAKQKISIKVESLNSTENALRDAINGGYNVTSIRLDQGLCSFRLTSDFYLRGIDIPDNDHMSDGFESDAQWEVANATAIMTDLCAMFAYKAPEQSREAEQSPEAESPDQAEGEAA